MGVAHPGASGALGANCAAGCSFSGGGAPAVLFSYDAPVITLVLPTNSPSRGGTTTTLLGINFGSRKASSAVFATVGVSLCAETRCALQHFAWHRAAEPAASGVLTVVGRRMGGLHLSP
jgi:hypothetical protein